jgi:hypothetical protein
MGCGASKQAVDEVSSPSKQTIDEVQLRRSGSSSSSAETVIKRSESASTSRSRTVALEMQQNAPTSEDLAGSGTIGAVAGAAAGGVVSAMASDSGMAEVGRATGEALVELAKTLPFIAPVAFLICAVASSAATAAVLKNDCMQFVKVLNTVEAILVKAENLEQV